MARAAAALMEMRRSWAGARPRRSRPIRHSHKKRSQLEKALADVVKDSKARFGDPWGIVALDAASTARGGGAGDDRVAQADGVLRHARGWRAGDCGWSRPRRRRPPAPRQLARRRRGRSRSRSAKPSGGTRSTSGWARSRRAASSRTTEADVERLFTELIPAEIAGAKGRRAEGPHPVLRARRPHRRARRSRAGADAVEVLAPEQHLSRLVRVGDGPARNRDGHRRRPDRRREAPPRAPSAKTSPTPCSKSPARPGGKASGAR